MRPKFNIRQGEIDRLRAERDALLAENAELREVLKLAHRRLDVAGAYTVADKIEALLAKTAKEEK